MINKGTLILLLLITISFSCPDNCNDCDPTGQTCFACLEDYELSVLGKCVSNIIDKCIVYGPANECFACQPTFKLSDTSCIKSYTGCVNQNTDGITCYECGFGTILANNACTGAINCINSSTICQSCDTGFELSNGKCIDRTDGCTSVRSNDGICSQCATSYKLIGYKCVKQNIYVPYCYIYYNSTVCERCKTGYSLFQNYCLLPTQIQAILQKTKNINDIIKDQLNETKNSKLALIASGVLNSSNSSGSTTTTTINGAQTTTTTTTITQTIQIPNCLRSDSKSCLQCSSGFFLSNSLCQPIDVNCISYQHATGICLSCNSGYDLKNNTCQKQIIIPNCQLVNPANTSVCLVCVLGYYPNGNGCTLISKLCDGSNAATGACFGCLYGLQLINGKCVDNNCLNWNGTGCLNCNNNYRINLNGICEYYDPNCMTYVGSQCDTCKTGYYVNIQGICLVLPNNCRFANVQDGSCIACNDGYIISKGICTFKQVVVPNCTTMQNNLCTSCNTGYYLLNNTCIKISVLCSTYNPLNGVCLSCISGYTLINGACFDLNCLNQNQNQCIQCKNNFRIISPATFCIFYDPNCLSATTTACVTCIQGYALGLSNLCEKSTPSTPNNTDRDLNCQSYVNNICSACSNRYYLGIDGKCVPINPLCQTYSSTGLCTSCYAGYVLTSTGLCGVTVDSDANCKTKNAISQCVECYSGFYLNGTKCTYLNPLCKTSNLTNGQCLSCYPGYSLSSGKCSVFFRDPNCQEFDSSNVCKRCAERFYFDSPNAKCVSVSPLCKTFNGITGACLTCYDGYTLNGVQCIVGTSINSDVNCKSMLSNGICQQCYSGYYLKLGKCTQINLLCKTSNSQTGICLSCYSGYILSNNECRIPTSFQQGDANCRQFTDLSRTFCKTCYDSYYPKQGICTQLNVLCKTNNLITGQCLSCYQGYSLLNGNCSISITSTSSSDPYCVNYNGKACIKCADSYFLNASGICQQLDPLCKASNILTGQCLSCYDGYSLFNNRCTITVVITIPYCLTTNTNGQCLECISGYYVNGNTCKAVSILCASYSKIDGGCTSCIYGYFYQEGQCIYPGLGIDPGCSYYTGAYCSRCLAGYYLYSYVCTKINNACIDFDYTNNVCRNCYNKIPQGAECV